MYVFLSDYTNVQLRLPKLLEVMLKRPFHLSKSISRLSSPSFRQKTVGEHVITVFYDKNTYVHEYMILVVDYLKRKIKIFSLG